jgi:hypothetical protein
MFKKSALNANYTGTFTPAFISQATLLFQIRKYRLAEGLSANLLINIGIWAVFLLSGVIIGRF